MVSSLIPEIPAGGFSFENCRRNEFLTGQGFPAPKCVKTGTTIAGLIYKDGVILGADTRATEGNIVADKNCFKIHYMAPNIYCAGAGTAADLEMTTLQMSSQLELHRLNTGRQVKVATANRLLKQMLFRHQGKISAALVLGGIDSTGPHVNCIYPHGSTDSLPFVSMGSGSLAAMAFLEAGWRPNMELEEAKTLMRNAIAGGVFNDLMSGSHVDLCVLAKGQEAQVLRPYDVANVKGTRQGSYRYPRGTTAVLSTRVVKFDVESTEVRRLAADDDQMEVVA